MPHNTPSRCVALLLALLSFAAIAEPNALLVRTPETTSLCDALETCLRAEDYVVIEADLGALCGFEDALAAAALLVLPDAADLPMESVDPIRKYLESGGDILALNAPLWQRGLIDDDGQWVDRDTYQRNHAAGLLGTVLFDFAEADLAGWRRGSNDRTIAAEHSGVPVEHADFTHALKVSMQDMTGWETFRSPDLDRPFPEGHTLTVFYAKGDEKTPELSIEWGETDGSRWIATVPLGSEWRQYVLAPKDFKFWESVPARKKGRFQPEYAVYMTVGLSHTHASAESGPHTYWLGAFGTASRTPEHEKLLTRFERPALEILSPGYKFFEPTGVSALVVREDQVITPIRSLPMPAAMRSTHPRPRVAGYDKGRAWRWLPLLEARTGDGAWRGVPAAMLVHSAGSYAGGVWASFAIDDPDWYAQSAAQDCVRDVLHAMRRGIFLIDGGAQYYTYYDDQTARLGGRVAALNGAGPAGLDLHVSVQDAASADEVIACLLAPPCESETPLHPEE